MHAACSSTRYESVKDRLTSQCSQEQAAVTPARCELPGIILVEAQLSTEKALNYSAVVMEVNPEVQILSA